MVHLVAQCHRPTGAQSTMLCSVVATLVLAAALPATATPAPPPTAHGRVPDDGAAGKLEGPSARFTGAYYVPVTDQNWHFSRCRAVGGSIPCRRHHGGNVCISHVCKAGGAVCRCLASVVAAPASELSGSLGRTGYR